MNNDPDPNRLSIDLSGQDSIQFSEFHEEDSKRVENIIYNIYIQEKSIDSPSKILNNSKNMQDSREEKRDVCLWDQLRKEFHISKVASINQLYTNQKLISHAIHYLMELPFIENSKKIIKSIVEYYDPSRIFIKSLTQSLVPVLENQEKSELNKINVILYTLNVLFAQQSPENPKFNSYIYLNGGQGIKVKQKMRWPFQKSGTICLWYNMSDETKECKLFEISGEKSGFQIVLKNKKIYFQKIKEQRGFSLMRNDSAFLCEAETNTDIRLWIQFETKKKIFQKASFINVVMNNFVLNNIELDLFTHSTTTTDYSISLFKNFHGKVSSALIFTRNLTKQVENLNSKQGFIYESDIKNFSYMFDNLLSDVLLLYTSIRAKTDTNQKLGRGQHSEKNENQEHQENTSRLFTSKDQPLKTIVFDALNGRNGEIGPQACVYRNISIHKKEMSLYGGLPTYIGFFSILKQHAKYAIDSIDLYTNALSELLLLFKNIFESKTASIEEAESIELFRIMSNFFIETEMIGYTEDLTPRLKQLYVSLNNRIIKQKFIKKFIWEIPAGYFLQISVLENYLNLVKGFYLQEIQNSLNVFNVKDIIYFILDKYDRSNCCFEHMRSSSIDHKKPVKRYQQVLAAYFNIIETIIEIKRYDNDLLPTIHQVISCFGLNASPCFIDALVKFLTELFQKDSAIEAVFIEQFETVNIAKMGLFSALANSYSWKTKANIINLILHIFGLKMFKEGGQKDMMTLCIRFPTITSRFSSIKSQDIDRSVDMSEDKFSFNSTGIRTVMAMRPLALEEMVQLNDEQIIKVIWQWGSQAISSPEYNLEQNQNPAIILLADLYKGSTYKIRKHITSLFLLSHDLFLFTPDLMAWVIECLLLCEVDQNQYINSDTIIYQAIQQTKQNLLKIIATYRLNLEQEQEESVQTELDIIKLILISVKSKYSMEISKLYHLVYLHISHELVNSFYEEIKIIKFENQEIYQDKIKNVISNIHRCIIEHFIHNGNDDFQFQDESQMEENQKQYKVLLQLLETTFETLLYLASPGHSTLMEEANAKRNQILFEVLFPEEGLMAEVPLLNVIFVALQGLFDNYDDHSNIVEKKLTLTLIKKFMIFMIEVSENSGSLKIQRFQQTLRNIFLNTLGFLQSKYYQYYFMQGGLQMTLFKNIEDIKNLIINIFLELIQLMKYIEQSSCAKHRSFYELMKPKKKHKNIFTIKNLYPTIWKKVDDHIIEFVSLNVQTLKSQEVRNKLEEHLKMKRLYTQTVSIEKEISKEIDKLIEYEKKCSQIIQKNSVYTYQKKQSEKCKIYTDFEERIAMFMFENNNKVNSEAQQRKIEAQSQSRIVKFQEKRIDKVNRVYEGFWANPQFYSFSQNSETFLYDNKLIQLYKRVRSNRQSKYLLQPFIDIEPVSGDSQTDRFYQEEVFTIDMIEDEGQKISEPERRKSDKYLNLGFQFLKKKVVQKIKKTALLTRSRSQETQFEQKSQQHYFKEVLLIEPMRVHSGTLKLDSHQLQFQFRPSTHFQHISLMKNKQQPEDLLVLSWKLMQIEAYQLKKFMLKPNSIEIYFKDKFSILFSFYDKAEPHFPKFIELLQRYKKIDPSSDKIILPLKILDPSKQIDKYPLVDLWKNREITNFYYLQALNILGGRSNCDLNQYFIFPWILSDYSSSKTKKDQEKYRDFEKNMGSLGSPERIQKFIEVKNTIEEHHKEEFTHSHYFGFHYSNLPIVLQYLIRLHPYSQGAQQLQGGKFDIADRLFTSIGDSFKNAISEMSDVRQLIPQFYYFPEFMINSEQFDFGTQKNNKVVNHVQLPNGYSNAYDFIEAHRDDLESEQVSLNLHKWIDLVFGYKQTGKEADQALNRFHYLSYENNANIIFTQDKLENRDSVQSHISYFGKVPSQLFTKPHPKRNPLPQSNPSQYSQGYTRANPFITEKPIPTTIEEQLIRHESGVLALPNESCIHFRYSEANKKYILLRRDGKGIIFTQERSENKEVPLQRPLSFNSALHFQIFLDKFECIYIFDESVEFQRLPISSLWSEHLFIGGLWGGKILKCDVVTKQCEVHTKHSDTVTALEGSEQLRLLVSGSINGQIIVWQYPQKTANANTSFNVNAYVHTSRKLVFKQKIVTHYGKINKIKINEDLRVAVCSGEDGLVSVIDTERYQVRRVLKIGVPIMNAVILNYPYYMFFISCKDNKQLCYSLNGQFMDEANLENLHPDVKVILINGYQDRVVVKNQDDLYFSMLKLPEMREELKVEIKKDDNQVLQFQALSHQADLEVIFTTRTDLVHCCSSMAWSKKSGPKKLAMKISE